MDIAGVANPGQSENPVVYNFFITVLSFFTAFRMTETA